MESLAWKGRNPNYQHGTLDGFRELRCFSSLLQQAKRRNTDTPFRGTILADRATIINVIAVAIAKSSNSNGKLTPQPESSVDHGSTETSLREIPSSRMEPAASTPTSVFAATPAINRNAHRQYPPRVREPKYPSY
jgi:hypothetical protein